MPCYRPLKGYIGRSVNEETGKRPLVFNVDQSLIPVTQTIACGRCIGCRLDRSLQWAARCVHEAQMHDENCFITLTFDNKFIDENGSLKVSDFQKFMKRLRKMIAPKKVRFFHCGEYGAKFSRPHHHACLFGYDFSDKVLFSEKGGNKLYVSPQLMKLWPFGFSTVGAMTFESAAYVARYVLKKWSEDNLDGAELYEAMKAFSETKKVVRGKDDLDEFSSENLKKKYYNNKKEEYVTMSRRPGIGQSWYDMFKTDVYPNGCVVINGKTHKPPKFYDLKFELDNALTMAKIKGERIKRALKKKSNTQQALYIKERIKLEKVKQLKRGLEQ